MNEKEFGLQLEKMNISMYTEESPDDVTRFFFKDSQTRKLYYYEFTDSKEGSFCTVTRMNENEFPENHPFYEHFLTFIYSFLQEKHMYLLFIDPGAKELIRASETYAYMKTVKEWYDPYREFYFFTEQEEEATRRFFFRSEISKACELIQQEDPIFDYNVIRNPICSPKVKVNYYYKGESGYFDVSFQNDSYIIDSFVCDSLDSVLREFLKTTERKVRLVNLYQAPTKYLKDIMPYGFSDDEIKTIHHLLSTKYDKEEIEIRAAKYSRSYAGSVKSFQSQEIETRTSEITITWYCIFDHFMMTYNYNQGKEKRLFVGTKEELQEQYEKHIQPKLKENLWNW